MSPTAARALRCLAVLALLGLVGPSEVWRQLDRTSFDLLSPLVPPPAEAADGLVVVGIDEPSFAELGLRWPWPRRLHADLVRALHAAGAARVVFDIVFAEPSAPADDAALAEAIRCCGPVVLSADEAELLTAQVHQRSRVEPLPLLLEAGATSGSARLAIDPDGVVRTLPTAADQLAPVVAGPSRAPPGALMRFFAKPAGPAYVSYYQALEPETFLPPGLFAGRIVLVGLTVGASPVPLSLPADRFLTPLTLTGGQTLAGVELQATAVANLTRGLWLRTLPTWLQPLAAAVLVAGTALLFKSWTPRRALVVAGIAALGLPMASLGLLAAGFWWPPGLALLGIAGVALAEGGAAFTEERKAKLFIKTAFARYLSPDLVELLAREPERLRLGGERRELTVLFCDIRGFTGLTERLAAEPERLTRLVNRFLGTMTRTIQAHGGTIDKYIGDCVMAFWNAPLADPAHARHACDCARAMLEALRRLNLELAQADPDLPPLRIGIGLNTGPCIVGNLGSDLRFAYSALGDPVNLAARLEELTKTYATPILLSAATAEAAGLVGLREVATVPVRGRKEPVRILALDAELEAAPSARLLR